MQSKNSDSVQFELKSFPKSDRDNLHVFNQELEALQRLQHQKGVVTLMDLIEDEDAVTLLLLR